MEITTQLPPEEVILSSSSSPSSKKHTHHSMSFSTCQEKAQAIRDCLQGNLDNEYVDLWQLRQLALLPGGLLSPSLRKSAWSKLLGISDAILTVDSTDNGSSVDDDSPQYPLSKDDVQALQKDVQTTNIQNKLAGKETNDSFWYAPVNATARLSSSSTTDSVQPSLLPSPIGYHSDNTSHTEEDDDDDSVSRPLDSIASIKKKNSVQSSKSAAESSQEQASLQRILKQVLEQSPDCRYCQGLSHLAALMRINLESDESLTSQLLSQLLTYHLHHVVVSSSDRNGCESTVTELLSRLVEYFHIPLNRDLQPIAKHVMTWFTSQPNRVPMISRLMDVFLVGHPLLPVYVGAATLTHRRGKNWTMDTVEHFISTGLFYMEQLPPSELLTMIPNSDELDLPNIPAWALATSAPTDWALLESRQEELSDFRCFTPTKGGQQKQQDVSFETEESSEWERLSNTSQKDLNQLLTEEVEAESSEFDAPLAAHFNESYPLALTAAGLALATKKSTVQSSSPPANPHGAVLRFAFLLSAMIALVAAYLNGLPSAPLIENFQFSNVPSLPALFELNFPSVSSAALHVHTVREKPTTTMTPTVTTITNTTEVVVPVAEQFLSSLLLQGMVNSTLTTMRNWNEASPMEEQPQEVLVLTTDHRLVILQALARQMQALQRIWTKLISRVKLFHLRRKNKKKMV